MYYARHSWEIVLAIVKIDFYNLVQWNLSVTTTSMIKFITCDLFSNVF